MTEDLHDALEAFAARFDFGAYETTAYLTILEHGEVTAAELADLTDIPQPRVYDTVRDLADSGLVEIQESRPMRVLAIDPNESFADIQSSFDDLVEGLAARYSAPSRTSEAVALIKSRPTILRNFEEIITRADYELLVSVSPDLLERFRAELAEQHANGVSIELLVSPAADAPDASDFDYAQVADIIRQRRGITTPMLAVADGASSVYATTEALSGQNDRYGVVFNRSELGFLVSGFFNTILWSTAETITEFDGDRPFPRRYATIRRCVSDINSLEGQFYATIAGRDVISGDRRSVRGRIVEASFSESRDVATLRVLTESGPVTIGGQVAAFEDIEAYEIRVDRESPPDP